MAPYGHFWQPLNIAQIHMVKHLLHVQFCCFKQHATHITVCLVLARSYWFQLHNVIYAILLKLPHTGLKPTISGSGVCCLSHCATGNTCFQTDGKVL